MNIRAAILWEQGQPLALEGAELAAPGPGDVLVEVKAAGVCHSDLHAANGDWPMRVPLVLGHEGAGLVREVGANVTHLKPGDRVVLCWAPPCGRCPSCLEGRPILCDRLDKTTFRNKLPGGGTRLRARDTEVASFLGTACFADHVVVPEEGAIRIDDDTPFESLAALGCAVVTGVGAVLNAAKVPAGATVAVIGAGGVGLNVVQGAAIAGCARIIAVDRQAAPLALATALGATDVVQSLDSPAAAFAAVAASAPAEAGSQSERKRPGATDAIRERTGGRGADFVFDTVGTPGTLGDALTAVRKGGTVVLTGLSRVDGQGLLPMFPFVMQEKRLIGSAYGSGQPHRDIPRLAALHQQGKLKLREIATRTYALGQVNEALAALAAGEGGRGVIRIGSDHEGTPAS